MYIIPEIWSFSAGLPVQFWLCLIGGPTLEKNLKTEREISKGWSREGNNLSFLFGHLFRAVDEDAPIGDASPLGLHPELFVSA